MGRIARGLFLLLTVTFSVFSAQCLTVCSLQPCAGKPSAPLESSDTSSCHHKRTPGNPAQQGHGQHGGSCVHQLLPNSSSAAAKAPIRVVTPVIYFQPVHASSLVLPSVSREPATKPSPPPNSGSFSITILRI